MTKVFYPASGVTSNQLVDCSNAAVVVLFMFECLSQFCKARFIKFQMTSTIRSSIKDSKFYKNDNIIYNF